MARPGFDITTPGLRIAPSLLAADFAALRPQLDAVVAGGADWLHLDVMDGHFVPNLSIGPPVIQAVRRVCDLPFDVHLMLTDPMKYVDAFLNAGADSITFHIEVTDEPHAVVETIRAGGAHASVCLNPGTPPAALEPVIETVNMVLVMSVWPGFGGQEFMPESIDRLAAVRAMLRPDQRLEVDGGIDTDTAPRVRRAGADVLVAGSAIFRAPDPADAVQRLRAAAERGAAD